MTQVPIYMGPPSQAAWTAFDADWFGDLPRQAARFSLSLEGRSLTYRFEASREPECDLSLGPGDFVEGLWESDVAELFLMDPTGRYHEINLAPTGAWWSAVFSSYRAREAAWRPSSVRTSARSTSTSWSASLSIDLDDLPTVGDLAGLRVARLSVTAILGRREPEYLCHGHRDGGEPDYHRASGFLPCAIP